MKPLQFGFIDDGRGFRIDSPTAMPLASAFLWNRRMMIHASCRGFASAQFMQPEPAKYAHAPTLEARSFMQPEQPYYAHHPGRFCYIKDEEDGRLFSVPYEPVRASADRFEFVAGTDAILWRVHQLGIEVEWRLTLPADDVVELWTLRLRNRSGRARRLSVYPYFPVGYLSWMNQSACYRADLGGIVCSSITPYQKVDDYFLQRDFKDRSFLLHDAAYLPDGWESRQAAFEGEGGLHAPSAIRDAVALGRNNADYEMPTAALQFRMQLSDGEQREHRLLFGPARDDAEIATLRDRYLGETGFGQAAERYADYLHGGRGCLSQQTPDPWLDAFANHWLPRQLYYHGDVNRLTTDPQTRNLLQDHMGMVFLQPNTARAAFLLALSQQESDGAMPDGILLVAGAQLKYINQVPHADHAAWLPVFLQAYLDETADDALLEIAVVNQAGESATVAERVDAAMHRLLAARDARGLSLIAQGDWCDPMNMVGYRGRGVSAWLTLATAHALALWASIRERCGRPDLAASFRQCADDCNAAVNRHLWDGRWYARGITDDDVVFGVQADPEGRIYLNPQSWAMLSGAADASRCQQLLAAVDAQLVSPYGVAMLDPPYTRMRDDIGRLTQKFPGSAENGSIYNHAAAFYLHALYRIGEADRAWAVLRAMLPGPNPEDLLQRGQLPVFVPNYYRGDWRGHPRTAGRSSQLFNTGTAAWLYRCMIEGLFGLRGEANGLRIQPQLPSHWPQATVVRQFRHARIEVRMRRVAGLDAMRIHVDGQTLAGNLLQGIEAGRSYQLDVDLPE